MWIVLYLPSAHSLAITNNCVNCFFVPALYKNKIQQKKIEKLHKCAFNLHVHRSTYNVPGTHIQKCTFTHNVHNVHISYKVVRWGIRKKSEVFFQFSTYKTYETYKSHLQVLSI